LVANGDDQTAYPLAERLRAARSRNFVGRAAELGLFRAALDGDPGAFAVLYVHGPGGIGKSTLLDRFADEARLHGRTVVKIDGRTVGLSPAEFEAEAGAALTRDDAVLLIDTFERCRGLESWLRDHFLPRLPAGVLVVLAAREPPDPRWRADLSWDDLLRVVALRNLPPEDALALLDARGVPERLQASLLSFAGGHPFALRLAAEVAVHDDGGQVEWQPTRDVLETLLTHLVGDVPSPEHRQALEVCAHALSTTEELLRATCGENAAELFAWLRQLPFVESAPCGIFPHDVVRDVLDTDLRWRDPQGYEQMHRSIRDHLVERIRVAEGKDLMTTGTALTFLYRDDDPVSAFTSFANSDKVVEDVLRPGDEDAVVALVARAEGEESARIARFWLAEQPEAFHVHRAPDTGEIVAFVTWLRLESPNEEHVTADPVVAAAWARTRVAGVVRPGEWIGVARFVVGREDVEPSWRAPDAIVTRLTVEWIRGERMAWTFVALHDVAFWRPRLTSSLLPLVDADVDVRDWPGGLFAHDWRVLGLQDRLDAAGVAEVARPAKHRAELIVLSKPEFDAAVRDALRAWRHPEQLAGNPLTRSRLVADQDAEPADALREVLTDAVDALREEPRGAKQHRAVAATFFHGVPTQEAAAERLGLPFSTYRRHLARGLEAVCEWLWYRELGL
jgi:hypothetical protein